MIKKFECIGKKIYSKRYTLKDITRKTKLNLIRAIKNSSFDQNSVYYVTRRFSKVFAHNFLLYAQNVFSLAVQLYLIRHEIFLFCQ